MDAHAGPFGQDCRTAHRLDRYHRGPRRDMCQRIDAPGLTHPQLTPHHDRVGFGMQRDPFAGRRHDSKHFQHRAGGRRRDLAEGVAHVELETDDAAGGQFRHVLDRVLAQQSIKPEVDVRFLGCPCGACQRECSAFRWAGMVFGMSNTVVTPPNAAAAVAREVLLVRIAGIAEMDVYRRSRPAGRAIP